MTLRRRLTRLAWLAALAPILIGIGLFMTGNTPCVPVLDTGIAPAPAVPFQAQRWWELDINCGDDSWVEDLTLTRYTHHIIEETSVALSTASDISGTTHQLTYFGIFFIIQF